MSLGRDKKTCVEISSKRCLLPGSLHGQYEARVMFYHNDVIKWKHFPLHWSPMKSSHKGQWLGALMFSLICAWINGWVNNREAGDLRRHCSHYDVIVMIINRPAKLQSRCTNWSLAVAPYVLNGLSNFRKKKRPPFWQTIFSIAFAWMKVIKFRFKFHWNMFLWVQFTISQPWYYLNQYWPDSKKHKYGTRGRWVEGNIIIQCAVLSV